MIAAEFALMMELKAACLANGQDPEQCQAIMPPEAPPIKWTDGSGIGGCTAISLPQLRQKIDACSLNELSFLDRQGLSAR